MRSFAEVRLSAYYFHHNIFKNKQMRIGIVIFCHKRHDKFQKLLDCLSDNYLLGVDKFYVYQDGLNESASQQDKLDHGKIPAQWDRFVQKKAIKDYLFERKNFNVGLRDSILSGMDSAFGEMDALIVLEDDLILHPRFVEKMVNLLMLYSNDASIGHINGWSNYQLFRLYCNNHTVRTSMMYCWGWGTWRDRWLGFRESSVWASRSFKFTEKLNYDYFYLGRLLNQLQKNWKGELRTWAVFWYLYLRLNNLKSVGYSYSLTENVGNDGSGVNCKNVESAYFSFLTDGAVSRKKKFIEKEFTVFNGLFYINLLTWLFLRDSYLLIRKIFR